jgi:hypothetical protein
VAPAAHPSPSVHTPAQTLRADADHGPMVAAHHPPPHPHHRPPANISKRHGTRQPQLRHSVVILPNVSITVPAFPIARPAQR